MKRIILFVVSILFVFSLCSCEYADVTRESKPANNTSMFVLVEESSSWYVVYHKDTFVMYAVSGGMHNSGIFTALLNPDGTPMLYQK